MAVVTRRVDSKELNKRCHGLQGENPETLGVDSRRRYLKQARCLRGRSAPGGLPRRQGESLVSPGSGTPATAGPDENDQRAAQAMGAAGRLRVDGAGAPPCSECCSTGGRPGTKGAWRHCDAGGGAGPGLGAHQGPRRTRGGHRGGGSLSPLAELKAALLPGVLNQKPKILFPQMSLASESHLPGRKVMEPIVRAASEGAPGCLSWSEGDARPSPPKSVREGRWSHSRSEGAEGVTALR